MENNNQLQLPSSLIARDDLSRTDMFLYALLSAQSQEGACTLSNKALSESMRIHQNSVSRHLHNLEQSGLIRREIVRASNNTIVGRRIYLI